MSKTERREIQTTRVVRTLSPQHRTTSNQNVSEFDSNLDNLLEDLQSSVSRPGSSLGNTGANTYKETRTIYETSNKTDSLGRMQHLSAANPTTIMTDDSYIYNKPGETVRSMKTYKENYASYNVKRAVSPEKFRKQNDINKLDTLLDDLQQARQGTLDRGSTNTGIDPGLLDSTGGSNVMSKRTVHRELVYDSDNSARRTREGSVERDIEYINEGTYGDIRPIRQQSPSRTLQSSKLQSYNYSKSQNIDSSKTKVLESVNPDINPNVLAQLDPNLLPPPNTKVTTTIKTYTYEIPGSGYPSTVSPKLSETVFSSNPSTPSKSFAYNKIESNTSTTNVNYPSEYVRPVSPHPSGHVKQIETVTSKNVVNEGYPRTERTPPASYIYKETTTTRNVNQPRSPPVSTKQVHIVNETTNINNVSHNGYPQSGYTPNQDYPPKPSTVVYKHDTHTSRNYGPDSGYPQKGTKPNDANPNVNITYKYSSHHTSSNNYRGHPNEESEPLLHPMPFPTEPNDTDGPPKKLEQLLAEMGKEPPNNAYNAGYNAKQLELAQKREVQHLTNEAQKKDIKDMPKSKNIAGPPVYYPPGHEMFSHKEESSGYNAQGGSMKESAKYKYEAKSGSKEKKSSGMAVVPVCLPLCCGLPCVIM